MIFYECEWHIWRLFWKPGNPDVQANPCCQVCRKQYWKKLCVAHFGVVYFHDMLQAAKMFNTHEYKMKSESFLNEHWICSAYMATLSRTSVIKVLNSVVYINMCFTKYQRRYGYFSFLFLIMFWFLIRLGCFHESGNLL